MSATTSEQFAAATATTTAPAAPLLQRIRSIDLMRGIVMIIMTIDHARDYYSPFPYDPTDLSQASPWLFLTRWITHYCAPTFMFLAGTSAFLYARNTGASRGTSQLIRQIAVLGLVFCAVALALAVPLRNYLAQRADLGVEISKQQQLQVTLDARTQEQAALADPAYIAAEAKRRLQYVKPGDTVYVVHAPALAVPKAPAAPTVAAAVPWYSHLWDTLSDPTETAAPGAPPSSGSDTPGSKAPGSKAPGSKASTAKASDTQVTTGVPTPSRAGR